MQLLNKRPESLVDMKMHYCPGCTHGVIHRLVAEVMDELDIRNRTIGIAPVGCSVFADKYFNCDMIQGPHGRGPAIATGLKRTTPGAIVFSYQGDGDLASIGMAEIVHTAIRSENITVIYVNNVIYGMTGGQMAPTTLIGQKATTCPHGRDQKLTGDPIKMSEMLATIAGAKYIERTSVHNAVNVIKTKKAIKKAFENQVNNVGFSMVEILSTCPTNWRMDPVKSLKYVNDDMIKEFPLGVYKDSKGGE